MRGSDQIGTGGSDVPEYTVTYQSQTVSHNFTVEAPCNSPTLAYTYGATNTTVNFAWTTVNGAQGYQIQQKLGINGTWADVATTPGNQQSYIVSNLTPNTSGYYLRVRTICGTNLFSDWKETSSFSTLPNCVVPTGLITTNITSQSALLDWDAMPGVQSYTVQVGHNGNWIETFSTSSSSLLFYNNLGVGYGMAVASNTTYYWRVKANCSSGLGSEWSPVQTFTTLPAVCNSPPSGSIDFVNINPYSVTAVCNIPAYRYQFRSKTNGSGWGFQVNPSSNNYRVYDNLSPCSIVEVQCRVQCQQGGPWSTYSVSHFITSNGCTPCGNPGNLTATANSSTLYTLSWSAVSGASTYIIEWRQAGNSSWQTLNGSPVSGTSKQITINAGTVYEWRIRANCPSGQSGWVNGPNFGTQGLTVSPSNQNVSVSPGSVSFSVNSNTQWTATDDASWVTISPANGTNSGTITATYSANAGSTPRVANITVTGGGNTQTVTLTQAANVNSSCSNDNEPANETIGGAPAIALNADKQSQIATTTDNDYWKFTLASIQNVAVTLSTLPFDYDLRIYNSNGTQIGSSTAPGPSNELVTLNNLAAGVYYARVYGYNGVYSTNQCYTLRVNSAGANTLSLTPANQNAGAAAGNVNFQVSSNVSWVAVDDASWLTISPASSSNNGTITAAFAANPGAAQRVAIITISGGGITQTATVTQSGAVNDCAGGNQYPPTALNPSSTWQYQPYVWGGEYCVVNVSSGTTYTFSYCPADGASLSFDGEISIRNTNDQLLAYSDDVCGNGPKIVWQSNITGQVRVLLTRYPCLTQQTASTLAYKTGNGFAGDEVDERSDETHVKPLLLDSNKHGSSSEASSPTDISIYPNPTTGIFNLELGNTDSDTIKSIEVVDPLGRVLWQYIPNSDTKTTHWEIDASSWPQGIYVTRVVLNKGKSIDRLVSIVRE